MPTGWETAGRLAEPVAGKPDILVIPIFSPAESPVIVFAENAFGCLQKQKLSLLSVNPAARSLVDGSIKKLVNTYTHT